MLVPEGEEPCPYGQKNPAGPHQPTVVTEEVHHTRRDTGADHDQRAEGQYTDGRLQPRLEEDGLEEQR